MKKITLHIALFLLFICVNSCAGYKPIFSSTNYNFKIADHSISSDKKLGNQIYSKLNNISNLNKNDATTQSIRISIDISKDKIVSAKSSTGKILEYKIHLSTNIIVNDFLSNKEILNQNFDYSSSYTVQDQHYETVKLENKTTENLVDKTYQDILIKITESIVIE